MMSKKKIYIYIYIYIKFEILQLEEEDVHATKICLLSWLPCVIFKVLIGKAVGRHYVRTSD